MTHDNDFAAKAAYRAFWSSGPHPGPWHDQSEEDKERWRHIAREVQDATPAPFVLDIAIKSPGMTPLHAMPHWHLRFGSTDAEIEQAGREFVARMKGIRDGA